MKLSIGFLTLWLTMALGQGQMLECTEELLQTEDCYEVMMPIACYNQFRWNAQTINCINGSDAEKKAKVRQPNDVVNVDADSSRGASVLQMRQMCWNPNGQLGYAEQLLQCCGRVACRQGKGREAEIR